MPGRGHIDLAHGTKPPFYPQRRNLTRKCPQEEKRGQKKNCIGNNFTLMSKMVI